MLQRNDSGYTVVITAPVEWPRLPVAVEVHPGDCADLPDVLFGWTEVAEGTPVVTVPTPPAPEVAEAPAPVEDAPEPAEPVTPRVSIPRQIKPNLETEK